MTIIMRSEERRNELLSILRAMQKELRVEELAGMLGVSPLTIRRDLRELAGDKAIIRTHGGCIAVGRAALESEYHGRVALNFELKQAIGTAAAREVRTGQQILINDGSTTFHLAASLGNAGPLEVYTNSIAMISEFSRFRNIRLYLLGGEYNFALYSLGGSMTERMVEMINFDVVFLGADAVDKRGRCLVGSQGESRMTQVMLRSGKKRVLLADHTKAGAYGSIAYSSLDEFDLWITTPGIPHDTMKNYRKQTHIVEAVP